MSEKTFVMLVTTVAGMIGVWVAHRGKDRVANNAVIFILALFGAFVIARGLGL